MAIPHRLVRLILACAAVAGCETERQGNYRPPAGYVPDAATAIAIAEAVWKPIYGERQLRSERPFHAELHGKVWHVNGTLRPPKPGLRPVGGTAEADIDSKTGKILHVIHEE